MKRKFKQLLSQEKDILKEIDEYKNVISGLYDYLKTIQQEIKATCVHLELESKSSYSYGGYDYQGEDRTWDVCKHCGEKFNLKIRYTGFG